MVDFLCPSRNGVQKRRPHESCRALLESFLKVVRRNHRVERVESPVETGERMPSTISAAKLAQFGVIGQAQREFFGAHTDRRANRPQAAFVHSGWSVLIPRSTL
jgi:6-phosphogluconate dehydrogenase